ncbi:MAG: hypothetical protein ACLSHU_04270 [Oscillospiraceae bacterium]
MFAFWLNSLRDFWILAVCVGMFQGTIQAISRSYYTKIIPAERAGEFLEFMTSVARALHLPERCWFLQSAS